MNYIYFLAFLISILIFRSRATFSGPWLAEQNILKAHLNNTKAYINDLDLKINDVSNLVDNIENVYDKIHTCNGISGKSLRVCSGHGKCIASNYCRCLKGYYGKYCEEKKGKLYTFGIGSTSGIFEALETQHVANGGNVTVSNDQLLMYNQSSDNAEMIGRIYPYQFNGISGSTSTFDFISVSNVISFFDGKEIKKIGSIESGLLFLTTNGSLYGLGYNHNGKLGFPYPVVNPVPITKINTMSPIINIPSSAYQLSAVDTQGRVYFGGYNYRGQLGIGNTNHQNNIVINTSYVAKEAICSSYVCFIKTDQDIIYSAGGDGINYLTTGRSGNDLEFLPIASLPPIKHIYSGSSTFYATAIDLNNVAWGWGYSRLGTVKNNTASLTTYPTVMAHNVKEMALGTYHVLLLFLDGSIGCRGSNYHNQCGRSSQIDPSYHMIPPNNLPLNPISSIHAALYQSFVQYENGDIYTFGYSSYYIGTAQDKKYSKLHKSSSPYFDMSNMYFKSIFGYSTSFAHTTNGEEIATGHESADIIGPVPVLINTFYTWNKSQVNRPNIKLVASGTYSYIFINSNDEHYVHGQNNHGQLGTGNTVQKNSPTLLTVLGEWNPSLSNIIEMKSDMYTYLYRDSLGNVFLTGKVDSNGHFIYPIGNRLVKTAYNISQYSHDGKHHYIRSMSISSQNVHLLSSDQFLFSFGKSYSSNRHLGSSVGVDLSQDSTKIYRTNLTSYLPSPAMDIVAFSYDTLFLTENGQVFMMQSQIGNLRYSYCGSICELDSPLYFDGFRGNISEMISSQNVLVFNTNDGRSLLGSTSTYNNIPNFEVSTKFISYNFSIIDIQYYSLTKLLLPK